MDGIDKRDVTARAIAGGWVLPAGWTVEAELSRDDLPDGPEDYDCYSAEDIAAWRNDDWSFGMVCVFVKDDSGRTWGRATIGGVEYGHMPGVSFIDPLNDQPGEYSVIREYDLIRAALLDAIETIAAFGTPVIVEPEGTTVTGL